MGHETLEHLTWRLATALNHDDGAELLHLLTCPECREAAAAVLRAGDGVPGVPLPDYDPMFRRLEANLVHLEEQRRRHGQAARLVAELLPLPHKEREKAVKSLRFERADVLNALLLEGEAWQDVNAAEAVSLGRLAVSLAGRLSWPEAGQKAAAKARALILTAGFCRLAGQESLATTLLSRAISFLDEPRVRGDYCRTLALLRWQQGRTEESIALFQRGARVLDEAGLPEEAARCRVPLGLLYMEQGEVRRALEMFLCLELLDPEAHPGLAARACLALALGLVDIGMAGDARMALQGAYRIYGRIRTDLEQVRVYWLESRVLARLGETEQALVLADQVMAKLLAEGLPAEAAVAGVELAGLLASLGRAGEVAERLAEVRRACASDLHLSRATETLAWAAEAAGWKVSPLAELASRSAFAMRVALRLAGNRVEPPPAA
jgi:tetratricopeptide (TPR) repeat protein